MLKIKQNVQRELSSERRCPAIVAEVILWSILLTPWMMVMMMQSWSSWIDDPRVEGVLTMMMMRWESKQAYSFRHAKGSITRVVSNRIHHRNWTGSRSVLLMMLLFHRRNRFSPVVRTCMSLVTNPIGTRGWTWRRHGWRRRRQRRICWRTSSSWSCTCFALNLLVRVTRTLGCLVLWTIIIIGLAIE